MREPMTRADWVTHDYNVHFCLGLENIGSNDVEIDLSVEGGQWENLPDNQPLMYAASSATAHFSPCDFPARTDNRRQYAVRVPVSAGERIYISNTLVRDLATLEPGFDTLAQSGGAERRVIGHTLQGREIVAYLYGDVSKGALLVTSGFHPPEPDTLASEAIMRHLATPEGRALSDRLAVALVPITNPDGYAGGTQGANAAGINFFWHFARELPDKCPEAAALWRFADGLAPRGYIDFHCYTFQLGKKAGPYQRPVFFHDSPAVRAACTSLYRRLDENLPGAPVNGFATFAPHTLGAMLAEQFDTIALAKYHLHLREGTEACLKRGVGVFKAMSETLLTHELLGPAEAKRPSWRTPLRRTKVWWAGFARPNIGQLRRGRINEIRFDRTALVPAGTAGN